MSPSASLTGIRLYPVKSLRGHDLAAAQVEPCGLAGDRRWMVVDPAGLFLTMRDIPKMAQITVREAPEGLVLEAPGLGTIVAALPGPEAEQIPVTVWRSTVPAVLPAASIGEWLTEALGAVCRLVHLRDTTARAVAAPYAAAGDSVSFADGFPLLLASTSSLDDLNRRLRQPLPITRFRPNLVISGAAGWAEDTWRRIRIGDAIFRVAKPCERCIVTTMDQETGERPVKDEPLRTLATFRRAAAGGVMFGQNLIPEKIGRVSVGDAVMVLDSGASNLLPAG